MAIQKDGRSVTTRIARTERANDFPGRLLSRTNDGSPHTFSVAAAVDAVAGCHLGLPPVVGLPEGCSPRGERPLQHHAGRGRHARRGRQESEHLWRLRERDSPIFVERKLGQSPASGPPNALGASSSQGAKLLTLRRPSGDAAVLAAAFPSMPADAKGPELLAPGSSPTANGQPAATAGQTPAAPPTMPPGPLPSRPARCCCRRKRRRRGSEQLEKTAVQTDQQVRHGFELANRGAYYAARAEFIAGLRLLAQALDAERHTTNHSRALSAGLTALKEAGDFLPSGGKLEADLDLPTIVASHRTPVLKNTAMENLVPLVALKSYFTFAQEQLSAAAGHEVAGSMALYALGKLHAAGPPNETSICLPPSPRPSSSTRPRCWSAR